MNLYQRNGWLSGNLRVQTRLPEHWLDDTSGLAANASSLGDRDTKSANNRHSYPRYIKKASRIFTVPSDGNGAVAFAVLLKPNRA